MELYNQKEANGKIVIRKILLYGYESWAIFTECRKWFEAFKMWCYRQMLWICWVGRDKTIVVLERVRWLYWRLKKNTPIGKIVTKGWSTVEGNKTHQIRKKKQYISNWILNITPMPSWRGCHKQIELNQNTDKKNKRAFRMHKIS